MRVRPFLHDTSDIPRICLPTFVNAFVFHAYFNWNLQKSSQKNRNIFHIKSFHSSAILLFFFQSIFLSSYLCLTSTFFKTNFESNLIRKCCRNWKKQLQHFPLNTQKKKREFIITDAAQIHKVFKGTNLLADRQTSHYCPFGFEFSKKHFFHFYIFQLNFS